MPDLKSHSIERASHDVSSDDDLWTCLLESEILAAIHQLKKGRVPGMDETSPEMLELARDEYVKWLNILSDCIWRE